MAQAHVEPFDLRGERSLTDKGDDSGKFARRVEERGGIVVIPSRTIAENPRNTGWHTYKKRHWMEILFLKLKNNCRFAAGYEKKAIFFQSVTFLACILIWLV